MNTSSSRPSVGAIVYYLLAVTLGLYFTFAAVQGDYGVFRQVEIATEVLQAEKARLTLELEAIQNRTNRLSDAYLDLDLLDEQARSVLGYVRADEVAIR
jgi:cell division protein FtsB